MNLVALVLINTRCMPTSLIKTSAMFARLANVFDFRAIVIKAQILLVNICLRMWAACGRSYPVKHIG